MTSAQEVDKPACIMHNEFMALIQIRDVPEPIRDELARKAAAAGQSMQAYLLAELTRLAERPIPKLPTLRGRTVVNLFYEDSTRTRISFEAAAKRLSADVINFSAKGSSVAKGESLKDTALTLQAMGADGVVIRHSAASAPHRLAGWGRDRIGAAGCGKTARPATTGAGTP